MTRNARWYLQRLRAMPLAEIAKRVWRASRYPLDRLRMANSSKPEQVANWRGPSPFYFKPDDTTAPTSVSLLETARTICDGKRDVLGLGRIPVPAEPWHFEPNAGVEWPRTAAWRVIAAAPAHLDPRLTWELNRGHEWVILARAFAATREDRFRETLLSNLAGWRRSNPIGVGINWASAMEASIRIHSLAWVAGFLRDDPALPEIATMLWDHRRYVADHLSYGSSANNHLIVELSALVVAGRCLHACDARSLAQLEREVDRQVFADGVDAEMATHYHAFVLEALLLVAYLERAHDARSIKLERVIDRMADYLNAISCANGQPLDQGDNDDGNILPFYDGDYASQLVEAATALATGEPALSAVREAAFWITGGQAATRPRPALRSRLFHESGQVVLRSERLLVTFDAGSFGFGSLAAHAHCDALAINLAADGQAILSDRGTYRYNGDLVARERFRMTAAHNTVQVGTREQAEPAGPFIWSRIPVVELERCDLESDLDIVQARHDGFHPVMHRRTLVHHDGILLVVDVVEGGDDLISRFHVAPGLGLSGGPHDFAVRSDEHEILAWLWMWGGDTRVVETDHSSQYAHRISAKTLEYRSTQRLLVSAIGVSGRRPALSGLLRRANAAGVLLPDVACADPE
jgi:Heparinase II/III-like protein/Heparinase II/III N-terminus